jgi:hypothetical protein
LEHGADTGEFSPKTSDCSSFGEVLLSVEVCDHETVVYEFGLIYVVEVYVTGFERVDSMENRVDSFLNLVEGSYEEGAFEEASDVEGHSPQSGGANWGTPEDSV